MGKGIIKVVLTSIAIAGSLGAKAQDIAQIANSDPLIISGAVGTMNTYNYSSGGYGSSMSNSIYANLNISVYGISMPFSFYYNNNDVAFSYPTFSFNISPTYKNWTLHLGERSMPFSTYVYNLPFNGVGLEYNGKRLRFGAFYGRLRKAVNDDPLDPGARRPQYKRTGWGVKVGYGTNKNYIDLYLFRAKDHLSSINEAWWDEINAEENIVLGLRGRVAIKNFLSFTANVAGSLHSDDLRARRLQIKQFPAFNHIFQLRYSSLMRFAGDANLNLSLGRFNTSISYRMVQPDYRSLGISYISNNLHSLGVSMGTTLFKRVSLSANFSGQADNLNGQQLYTTRGFVYAANLNVPITQSLSFNGGYNGYLQRQYDGTEKVNDSTRVDRMMNAYRAGLNYSLNSKNPQSFSLNFNYNENKDLNPFTREQYGGDVATMAAGLGYNINVESIETDFGLNYSFQRSDGYDQVYSSHVISANASRAFLKEKQLRLSANLSGCVNKITGKNRTFTVSADVSVGYTLKKVHNFSLSGGYFNYNDLSFVDDASSSNYSYNVNLNYSWTFTLLHIKKQAKKQKAQKM